MEAFVILIFAILWGYICYRMAEKRHRNTILAVILGVCFGVLAVIGYAITGDKENK